MAEPLLGTIERFLASCQQPAALEPGERPFPLNPDCFALEERPNGVLLEAWDDTRHLARRIRHLKQTRPGRMTATVERFGGKTGELILADLAKPQNQSVIRTGERSLVLDLLRRFVARQFPGWRATELTAGADLENTLSPNFPRALVERGKSAWAVLAAPPGNGASALTHALIWLDYLRRRNRKLTFEGLAIFLPLGEQLPTCLRLRWLALDSLVFVYDETGFEQRIDPLDSGNIDTRLDPFVIPPSSTDAWVHRLSLLEDVEVIPLSGGARSLRVRGLEFARQQDGTLLYGVERRRPAHTIEPVETLAAQIRAVRQPEAPDPHHPWYLRAREAWLESRVRADLPAIDAALRPGPVYGQVSAVTGLDRGVIDLLGVDRAGRLAVIELKAGEDLHLPLQALDYWMRVAAHAERDEFLPNGYFAGIPLRRDLPRLLLVAPALHFHPSTESVLRFFRPEVPVERVGLSVEWQKSLRVVFRAGGSRRLEWS